MHNRKLSLHSPRSHHVMVSVVVEIVVLEIAPSVRKETDHEGQQEIEGTVAHAFKATVHEAQVETGVNRGIDPHAHRATDPRVHKVIDPHVHREIVVRVRKEIVHRATDL